MQSIIAPSDYSWFNDYDYQQPQSHSPHDFDAQTTFSLEQAWAMGPYPSNPLDFASAQPSVIDGPGTSHPSFTTSSTAYLHPTKSLLGPGNTYLPASPQDSLSSFDIATAHTSSAFGTSLNRPASAYATRTGTPTSAATSSLRSTPDSFRTGSHPPTLFMSSPTASEDGHGAGSFINARRVSEYDFRGKSPLQRARRGTPSARLPGACVRCKRLKMKCTFLDQTSDCVRCESGRHECMVEGRKPRTPGQREQLLRQIRSKNEAIGESLRGLRWHAPSATPLSIVSTNLPLSPEEREKHRDALSWLEKRPSPTRTMEHACTLIDTSELEDEEMRSDDEDDEDGGPSPSSLSSPSPDSVLAQSLSSLDELTPLNFTAKWSRRFSQGISVSSLPEGGLANGEFFEPSPYADLNVRRIIIERELVPEILLSGLVTTEDARALFEIFFQHMNPYLNILDEAIHNAASVMRRSPFLFTVVCAVASRYYTSKPDIYSIATHLAKAAAASAVIDGFKCVETCQAFIILAAYGSPVSRSEDCRKKTYVGIAVRLAAELGLDTPPSLPYRDERSEREALNKVRTWMLCWIMDSAMSLESGRVPDVPEDKIIRDASRFCTSSKYHTDFDANFSAIIELFRVLRRFWESVAAYREGSSQVDLSLLVSSFDKALAATMASRIPPSGTSQKPEDAQSFAGKISRFALNYSYLTVYWFTQQVESSTSSSSKYLPKAAAFALELLREWSQGLAQQTFARYAPDPFFAGTGFASVFLLQLLRPQFVSQLTEEQRMSIASAVQVTARLLASGCGAVDISHVSRRYSVLLENTLRSMMTP